MSSALSKGFVSKSSHRMVQKMAEFKEGNKEGIKKQSRTKGANVSEQKQQGQGNDMFFQTVHGHGFADNIFPGEQQVSLNFQRVNIQTLDSLE